MSRQKGDKGAFTEQRHKLVYDTYLKHYKQEGAKAPFFPKSYFYELTANEVLLSEGTVCHIVRKQIKAERERSRTHKNVIECAPRNPYSNQDV